MKRPGSTKWVGSTIIATLLAAQAGAQVNLGTEAQRENGRENYAKYCSQCHGDAGDGIGHATDRVKPQPRDFTAGQYKFRSTPNGTLPTDADIARVIKVGLPYTSMPGWPNFSDQEIQNLVFYLKTFSADFENAERYGEPIAIGSPVASSEESLARGRTLYEEQGCAACHGEQGRSNGLSAPTLEDDWGQHIRPADLTQPWTWRGGSTKADIYRTFSTGLNGTPMPAYADVLEPEDRWHLVNYIESMSPSRDPEYASLMLVPRIDEELDLEQSEELFAGAPVARFPLIGQIVQPGRNFYPSTTSVAVQAVYNRKELAIRVRWNDLRADTSGSNSPLMEVPLWDEDNGVGSSGEDGESDSFFGDAVETGADDFFGDAVEPSNNDDFFGDAEESADDFFGEEDDFFGSGDSSGSTGDGFSDAIAIQMPQVLPTGNRKPYFLFGDSTAPVDIWHLDLGSGQVTQYLGRGSDGLEVVEADDIEVSYSYDDGQWTAIFKRSLRGEGGVTFTSDQYVPVAFSVWDGFNRERGNKRSLSSWVYFYNEPETQVSPFGPMVRAALLVLLLELVIIFLVRQRHKGVTRAAASDLAGSAVA